MSGVPFAAQNWKHDAIEQVKAHYFNILTGCVCTYGELVYINTYQNASNETVLRAEMENSDTFTDTFLSFISTEDDTM